MEIWQLGADGEKVPISLAVWHQMNALISTEATKKIRSEGPPQGGMGVKNWLQHTHPGTEKASLLPPNERFGHVVLRFNTLSAQDWFRPLVEMVEGKDGAGNQVHLIQEVDSDETRAKYSAAIDLTEYETFGDTQKEKDTLFYEIIMFALGVDKLSSLMHECGTYSSRYLKQDGKPDQWCLGIMLVPMLESRLDKIILDERFGTLPTAVCPVRILKQKNTMSKEDLLAARMNATGINPENPENKETTSQK